MADIYGGCEFALSALSSHDASEGFLRERRFRPVSVGRVRSSYGTWYDDARLFIRRIPRTTNDEINSSSLSRRAWALQERLLAPAVLHYGRDEVIWECDTDYMVSETGEIANNSETSLRLSDIAGATGHLGTRALWDCILEEFTRRKLTFVKDRLPAISGIASKLREKGAASGRYMAGLWEGDLEYQLAWRTGEIIRTRSFEPSGPSQEIPTWSWAHRDLPIDHSHSIGCASALLKPAKFFFVSNDHDNSGRTTAGGIRAISLRGYVQELSTSALFKDSFRIYSRFGNCGYPGLPGSDSRWWPDLEPFSPGIYSCIRTLHKPRISDDIDEIQSCILYLVLRKAEPILIPDQDDLFTRVGVLMLYEIEDKNFTRPYPDVFCKTGAPLLTNGACKDITLI